MKLIKKKHTLPALQLHFIQQTKPKFMTNGILNLMFSGKRDNINWRKIVDELLFIKYAVKLGVIEFSNGKTMIYRCRQ